MDSVPFDTGKYGRGAGGLVGVIRTAVFDVWVRDFLAEHPGGTVVELGTGLNTRFERVDNGTVHWIDLDLPPAFAGAAGPQRRRVRHHYPAAEGAESPASAVVPVPSAAC